MQALVLISLIATAWCAPAPVNQEKVVQLNSDTHKAELVKRAQETIMYGNQQNAPKVMKRDPSLSPLSDAGGSVYALPAQDIIGESDAESIDGPEEAESYAEEGKGIADALEGIDNQMPGNEEQQSVEVETPLENEGDELIHDTPEVSPDDLGAIEEGNDNAIEAVANKAKAEIPDIQDVDEELVEEGQPPRGNDYDQGRWYDELFDYVKTQPEYPVDSYDYYGPRMRPLSLLLQEGNVKRGHRAKRDLIYPGEEPYFDPVYFPETGLSEEYGGTQLEPYEDPEDEDRYMQRYLQLLAENEEQPQFADLEDNYEEEDEPGYEGVKMVTYEGEPGYFVPVKRQDLLSFVPGNKRSNYFYPFSEEPETHYGAFLPSKRNAEDYTQAYGRLIRLARQLAVQRDQMPDMGIGYEDYQWE